MVDLLTCLRNEACPQTLTPSWAYFQVLDQYEHHSECERPRATPQRLASHQLHKLRNRLHSSVGPRTAVFSVAPLHMSFHVGDILGAIIPQSCLVARSQNG